MHREANLLSKGGGPSLAMVEDSEREPPSVCGNAVSNDNNFSFLFYFDFSIHQALQQIESDDSTTLGTRVENHPPLR